jgi:hypothetical protein
MPFFSTPVPKRSERCQASVLTTPPPEAGEFAVVLDRQLVVLTRKALVAAEELSRSASPAARRRAPGRAASGCGRPAARTSSSAPRWSQHSSITVDSSPLTGISPLRSLSRTFSTLCVKASMKWHSTTPAPPLMVCAARKMAPRLSASSGCCSSLSRPSSMASQLVAAFVDEGTGQFIHRVPPRSCDRSFSAERFQACAEMSIGSPKTPTRLQKSRILLDARAVADDRQALALLQPFALEQQQELQAGGIHLG